MPIRTVFASRELLLPPRKRLLKISIGLGVSLKPRGDGGNTLGIGLARKLNPMLEPVDIRDAIWSFGICTGVDVAIYNDEFSRLSRGYDIEVQLRSLNASVSIKRLTSLELAQVGSLVRDMVRAIVREAIVRKTGPAPAARRR